MYLDYLYLYKTNVNPSLQILCLALMATSANRGRKHQREALEEVILVRSDDELVVEAEASDD